MLTRKFKAANVLRAAGAISLVILTLRSVLVAQAPASPPWLQLTIVQVEPAMVDEYIAVQREVTAHIKRGGPPWRTVSRADVFGDTYRFLIVTPVQNLATFDATKTDPELAALMSRSQKYVKSQQIYAIRTIPELDNPLPEKQQPALMVVNVARISPGREQAYLDVMKADFLPHFNKAKFYHVNGAIAFGGESGFIHLFYVQNFAKLDEGSPVVRALGAAGAQAVTTKLAGIVISTEQWVARLLSDLSYGPWSTSPATKP